MIEATVYFDMSINFGALVESLKSLSEPIMPVHFAEDEGKISKANKLSDKERFQVFLKGNPRGFFLYANNGTCFDVSSPTVGYASVTMYLVDGVSSELVQSFFRRLADHKPVFGFACEYEEYIHRNRHFITIGKNHIEDWIGRKLEKYISGLYWCTLLSDGLLVKHGVNLSDLVPAAMTVETFGDGSLHLLKFFSKPEEWKENMHRLDDLCDQVEGVFSRRAVEAAVVGIKNIMEYDDVIANWR